jgi:tetratricopeptide (TPR) repeat protein
LDKSNFEPYFIAGLNYKELKDTAKAIEQFKMALQYKPDMYDAYMQLGLLTSAQKSQLATQYFDNAIRIDSTIPESYYAKAKYFQDINNFKEAKATYRKLITISPQNANAFFNMGFIYILEDSIPKAKKYFDYAIKVNPIYADAYYYRGLCEYELGEIEYAKSDLTQCLALDPDNEKAQSLLNTINKK